MDSSYVRLDDQIDLPYCCQTGSCAFRKVKLTNAKVKELILENWIENWRRQTFALSCYSLTGNVKFQII